VTTDAIESLNALDRAAFVGALGHLFEHSPWVAEETWPRRPFRDAAHLHAELCATMRAAPRERQLALIRAHPDLGGRLSQPLNGLEPLSVSNGQRTLTPESAREQASAGLNTLAEEEVAAFQRLNDAYRARFGFPFVICARLNAREAIIAAMQRRLVNAPETEFDAALAEIEKIARLRLDDSLNPD
jgi:2-oxo-4-hydroxy-4-carboxy-5-ureidoimidazoline decarboxylase